MFFVVQRATLLIPSGPPNDPDRKHLFICVTDPVGVERQTLIVPVSTLVTGLPHDPACRLFAGDHPFIRHDSFVSYRQAQVQAAARIERGVKEGRLIAHDILDGAIFARVCLGLTESRFVPPSVLAFYRAATGHE